MKILVYVLAHNDETLAKAKDEYGKYDWAKPILIPQTIWLESIMYVSYLQEHRAEWEDMDYVGAFAWSASSKQPLVHRIPEICAESHEKDTDVIALMSNGDPLVETAERWHPGFTGCWLAAWRSVGFNNDDLLLHTSAESFYCNYWLARPSFMTEYCTLMAYFDLRLRLDETLKKILWQDSDYETRGKNIAKMPVEAKMTLWNVPYYPQLVFVAERMICLYVSLRSKRTCFIK